MGILTKALSIVRPGGSLIAAGKKTLEIRRWRPDLMPDEDLVIVENERFLKRGDEDVGAAVALVRVGAVRPFARHDMLAACANSFEEGWLAWELGAVRPFPERLSMPAKRKIYEVVLASNFEGT
ncbi:MAG TPA: ASCH domain-containing protein [Rhodoblastus sp.]|nr:ASCH domain-containing protein [Rhodoblastus sp.]